MSEEDSVSKSAGSSFQSFRQDYEEDPEAYNPNMVCGVLISFYLIVLGKAG